MADLGLDRLGHAGAVAQRQARTVFLVATVAGRSVGAELEVAHHTGAALVVAAAVLGRRRRQVVVLALAVAGRLDGRAVTHLAVLGVVAEALDGLAPVDRAVLVGAAVPVTRAVRLHLLGLAGPVTGRHHRRARARRLVLRAVTHVVLAQLDRAVLALGAIPVARALERRRLHERALTIDTDRPVHTILVLAALRRLHRAIEDAHSVVARPLADARRRHQALAIGCHLALRGRLRRTCAALESAQQRECGQRQRAHEHRLNQSQLHFPVLQNFESRTSPNQARSPHEHGLCQKVGSTSVLCFSA